MKLMMNKLQLDLLRRHAGPFVFCFLTLMFLQLMQFLILHIDKLVGKGLPLGVVVELILTNLAYMVVMAAPMAVLVSTLFACGKFSELNELTALRAAGINPIRVINPLLCASVLLSLFLAWFSNDVLPDANQRARSLFLDIRMKKPGFDLRPNEFYTGIDGYTFLVEEMDSESDSLYNVTLFQETASLSSAERAIIKANRGILEGGDNDHLTLFLVDGSILRYVNTTQRNREIVEETHFNRYRISFDISDLAFYRSNPNQRTRNDRTMSSRAMLAVVDTLKNEITQRKQSSFYDEQSFRVPSETLELYNPFPLRQQISRTGLSDSLASVESIYTAANLMKNQSGQAGLIQQGLSSLRSYKSNLNNLQTNVEWREANIAQYMVEVHKKFSIPFSCIIFVLVGAPIGMFTKKGNLGIAALISAGVLTFFWLSLIQGEKMADRLFISPFLSMWASNIILGVVGGYLLIRLCSSFKLSNIWDPGD